MGVSAKGLISKARTARKRAVATYSRFHVGAAVEGASGRVYTGCNIESSSYSLTICAERTAIFKAISEGEKKFKAIAIVSDSPRFTAPCGACRQVLMDLAGNIQVIMANRSGSTRVRRLKDLLPEEFGDKDLPRKRNRR